MTKKQKLQIISKFGLLLVFIGFFMPITCNLNGFQIAQSLETFGGTNLISISLYVIFIGSCAGLFLLLLLLAKVNYHIMFDGINVIVIIAAVVFLIINYTKDKEESMFSFLYQLQSGAYVICAGTLIAFISLTCIPEGTKE